MGTIFLKLFFCIILMFNVTIADFSQYKYIPNCFTGLSPDVADEVVPIKYNVSLVVNTFMKRLTGEVDIMIDIKIATKYIMLHARGLETNIERSKIVALDAKGNWTNVHYNLEEARLCVEADILSLIFNKDMDEGKYLLHIEYTSISNKTFADKIFYSSIPENNQTWLFTNLYTPNGIRGVLPCWDDPTIKTPFEISIWHYTNFTVCSSMPIKKITFEGDARWTYFEETDSIPTYLLAIAMADNVAINEQRGPNFMWHKLYSTKIFEQALVSLQEAMIYLTNTVRMDPREITQKIDHMILSNNPMKSMAGLGLAVYREKDVRYDENSDFLGQTIAVSTLMTYEIARQFFVGFVSPHLSVDDVWLNEILASFYSYNIVYEMSKSDRLMDLFVVQTIQPALDSDVYIETNPIIHKAKNIDGIDALLYPLLYHKKAFALIRMLFYIFTPEIFNKAIKEYVQSHDQSKNLWTAFEETYPQKKYMGYTVNEIMDSWLMTKHHPELLVIRSYHDNNALCVVYYPQNDIELKIPINYITQSNLKFYTFSDVIWLTRNRIKNITGISAEDFLIINAEQVGYFRVNYDNWNWEKISSYLQISSSSIPVVNRAQLINDAYYFTTNNQLDSSIFINITRYLKSEVDFIAWYPMFNIFTYMSTYFNLPESANVKKHFSKILDSLLIVIDYNEESPDNAIDMSLILLARKWACKLGVQACRNAATTRLKVYIQNHELQFNTIPSKLKDWVLCSGIMEANINIWHTILNTGQNLKNMEIFEYLTCSEYPGFIMNYLNYLKMGNFNETKLPLGRICLSIVKKHAKKNGVLQHLLKVHDELVKRYPAELDNYNLLTYIVTNVYSLEQLDMIENLITKKYFLHQQESFSIYFNMLMSQRRKYLQKVIKKFAMF